MMIITILELCSLYMSSLPNEEQSYDKELCANFIYTRSGIISTLNASGILVFILILTPPSPRSLSTLAPLSNLSISF